MKGATAEIAAELTGQPKEVYTDDSRSGERAADVLEVDRIRYPVDESEITRRMTESGRKMLILTDGEHTHLFKLVAGAAIEVTSVTPGESDVRSEVVRILMVYRQNCRFNDEWESLDILKGLILFAHGHVPDTREEAEEILGEIVGGGRPYVDIRIRDWDPVKYALDSLNQCCPDVDAGTLGKAYLSVFERLTRDFFMGTEVVSVVVSSFVETPCTMLPLVPFVAASLPSGSVLNATLPEDEAVGLFMHLMDVGGCFDERSSELSPTVIDTDIGVRDADADSRLIDLLNAMPDGGRLIMINMSGILYSMRSSRFRSKVQSDFSLNSVIRIKAGLGIYSRMDAVVLVIDKTGSVSPTEFVTIPDNVEGVGDWREWSGVKRSSFMDYGDDWSEPFDACYNVKIPEGNPLGDVADIRKGSMINSASLFPSNAVTGIPFVTPRNLTRDGLSLVGAKKAPASVNVITDEGDILITCNSSATRIYRMRSTDPQVAPSYAFAIVRPNRDFYIPEFLELYFRTEDFLEQVKAGQSGRMMVSLSKTALSKIIVPDVDLDTQMDMVDCYREAAANNEDSDPDAIIFGKDVGDTDL